MSNPEVEGVDLIPSEVAEVSGDGKHTDIPKLDTNYPAFNGVPITALMNNPDVVAAIQNQMNNLVGTSAGYISSLPTEVKRRIKSLKKMQFDIFNVEADFYQRVRAVEFEFQEKYNTYYDKRCDIVNGNIEPTDSDCDWSSDEEGPEVTPEPLAEIEDAVKEGPVDGIPEFWLTIFKNVEFLNDMVQEDDYPVLKHLIDVKCDLHKSPKNGFDLNFIFSKNEFFDNTLLKKSYDLRIGPVRAEGYNYEGPEIYATQGCTINWYPGKNVTVKSVEKKLKKELRTEGRTTVSKLENVDSFFNFFSPPESVDGEEIDEDLQGLLSADFEIGHFISERLIQRAVLYFTGDAISEDEEDEDEDEDEEYDEEEDEDYVPSEATEKCKQQ